MIDGRDVGLWPRKRESKTVRLRDPALFRRVKKLIYDFCLSRGFPEKKRIGDSEAMHSALILCEKHLDPAKSAVVVNRERLQAAIDHHVAAYVSGEVDLFIQSVVPSLSTWLGVRLSVRKEGERYLISSVGPPIPRPQIPDGELEIAPPEITSPSLDINNLIVGLN